MSINVQEKLIEEYKQERQELYQQGGKPVGVNSHLESFISYLEWRRKTDELFENKEIAKELR